ncbi:hypothetical protein COLU111180_18270 [Cohnella lubricantis]|uniref:Uncharacterized protein n=1 Tax=Cohnella lubricantis TaxID=2163172 RepID=A0A841TG04_9BACL|nr:hypothetical protein [Cohnella lubricantis]MBB6679286.1 hypothetical protein [Cohnella lubricantis]MBP2120405.1 hypothetical protein [Cohnella lubricantis]
MPCDSTNSAKINSDLYFIAGFRTAPLFMEEFRVSLQGRLEKAGARVRSKLLFPYGDWSRGPVSQLLEIRRDMRLSPDRLERSIGGRHVLEAITRDREASLHEEDSRGREGCEDRERPRLPILIGHSGGGVAAVHASSLLLARMGGTPCPVVMIGSPKCRIPDELRGSVLYLHAARRRGREGRQVVYSDPVTRLGTFGGWHSPGSRRWRTWRRDQHAPGNIVSVPIVGGHADYFRSRAPFIDGNGLSNLDLISEEVWHWLMKMRLLAPPL